MIAFQVSVNGERKCLAGIDGKGVLSAILTWVSRPEHTIQQAPPEMREELSIEHTGLRVGGLSTDGKLKDLHHAWLDLDIKSGDKIELLVVDADAVDAPYESKLPPHKAKPQA